MKFIMTFEAFNHDGMQHIGRGSESEIYTDGEFAYRVTKCSQRTFDYIYQKDVAPNLGKTHRNVVKIYDAFFEDGEMIIKMERLQKIDTSKIDPEEFDRVIEEIHTSEDNINNLPPIIETIHDPQLKKMIQAIYDAGIQLGTDTLDINIDNLMFDPKTREYKQVDIF
jgi:hypothetical protein